MVLALAEPGYAPAMPPYDVRGETRTEQPTAVARATLAVEEIGPWLAETYGALAAALARQGVVTPAGLPFARYGPFEEGRVEVEAGFPVSAPVAEDGVLVPSVLPGGPVAVTTHLGPYDAMQPAYAAVLAWVEEQGGQPAGHPWETYFTDPSEHPDPATWRTDVVQPYRPA
jgi:effector-binding domain-containing protein